MWLQLVGSCQGHSRKQTTWSSGLIRQNLERESFTKVWAGLQESLLKRKMKLPGLAMDKSQQYSYIQRDKVEERRCETMRANCGHRRGRPLEVRSSVDLQR